MRIVAGMHRVLTVVILVGLVPQALPAQRDVAVHPAALETGGTRGCRIFASVWGGGVGLFVGAAVGARLEQAVYDGNPEAGLTGGFIGGVAGAVLGVKLGRRACGEIGEDELRRHLREQVERAREPEALPEAVDVRGVERIPSRCSIRRHGRASSSSRATTGPPPS